MLSERLFPDVFLSYAHEDGDWVRDLVSRLQAEGVVVFFDREALRPGDDIHTVLDTAVSTARHVVLVLSDAALRSEWVKFESTYHWGPSSTGKLIPLRLTSQEMPRRIARLQCIDFRPGIGREPFSELLAAIIGPKSLKIGPVSVETKEQAASLAEALRHRIERHYEYSSEALIVLEDACAELAINGLEHGSNWEEPVHVVLDASERRAVIEVADHGQGFDLEEVLKKAAEQVRSEPKARRGRGLYLVFLRVDHLEAEISKSGTSVVRATVKPGTHHFLREDLRANLASTGTGVFTVAPRGKDWAHVVVRGKMTIGTMDYQFREAMKKLMLARSGLRRVAIDLWGCRNIDSSGMGELTTFSARAMEQGIAIKFAAPAESAIFQMFSLCGLDLVFEFVHSREKAAAWAQGGE